MISFIGGWGRGSTPLTSIQEGRRGRQTYDYKKYYYIENEAL